MNIDKLTQSSVADEFSQKIRKDARIEKLREYAPLIIFIVMTILAALFVDNFLSWENVVNLLYQMTLPLILATGLTFVLLIGSIDLSMEGVMGFSGSLVAILIENNLTDNDLGIWSVVIVLAIGTLVGVLTGLLHVKMRIPSFVVSFAMGTIMYGFGLFCYKSKGSPPMVTSQAFVMLSQDSFLGIPYITWMAFAVFAIGYIILNYTAFGRAVYAVGDNESAARSTGINVDRVKVKIFALCALAASIAGVVATIRLKIGQVGLGDGNLFPAITAVTVGGLVAGKGGMLQTLVGVMIYVELANFLVVLGVDSFYKEAIQGIIILIAVALSYTRSRKTVVK